MKALEMLNYFSCEQIRGGLADFRRPARRNTAAVPFSPAEPAEYALAKRHPMTGGGRFDPAILRLAARNTRNTRQGPPNIQGRNSPRAHPLKVPVQTPDR